MPRVLDEDGDVVLDPAYPPDVQQTAEGYRRWEMASGAAANLTGLPADHPEAQLMARVLFNSDMPTNGPMEPLEEADLFDPEFDDKHPRGRAGRFAKKFLPIKRPPLKAKHEPEPPEVSLKEIEDLGLNDYPEPTELANKVLDGARTSAQRWYALRAHTDLDSSEHPPYKAERRRRHDKIVGAVLADAVGSLLGKNHAITQKLAKGGRLSENEKQIVRQAAHDARDGDPPDALFMAGGPASGKTTVLDENPDLRPKNSVHIDPDKIKDSLPEYQKLRAAKDHYAATAVHRESGDIAARLRDETADLGLNVVIDGTGDSEPDEFTRQLLRKHQAGYDVSVMYANVPTDIAIRRAVQRAKETGRWVPIPTIREQHQKVSRNFAYVAELPWLENIDVFDAQGHIGAKAPGGTFHDFEPARMKEFRDKENETPEGRGATLTGPPAGKEPLDADGEEYAGGHCTDLATAFVRKFPNLKIKALYSGDPDEGATLEHAVAYDPASGRAYDAFGVHDSADDALDGFGDGVKRDEPPEAIFMGDSASGKGEERLAKASAWIDKHFGRRG